MNYSFVNHTTTINRKCRWLEVNCTTFHLLVKGLGIDRPS